eukprot:3940922-Rhodomonas_salina.2
MVTLWSRPVVPFGAEAVRVSSRADPQWGPHSVRCVEPRFPTQIRCYLPVQTSIVLRDQSRCPVLA